jgi:hypothetical protein
VLKQPVGGHRGGFCSLQLDPLVHANEVTGGELGGDGVQQPDQAGP